MNIYISTILLLAAAWWIKYGECFEFLEPTNEVINANNSGEATFSWKFRLGNAESNININCGYVDPVSTNLVPVVHKINIDGIPQPILNTKLLGRRVKVYIENNGNTAIGFKITKVAKSDPKNYKCQAGFTAGGIPNQNTETKTLLTLSVYDPPKFDSCLDSLQRVRAGDQLRVICAAIGYPTPYLQCNLLDENKNSLAIIPPGGARQTNFTNTEGTFDKVPKLARFITCQASSTITGSTNKTRAIIVEHTPLAPKNFSQIKSTSESSINVQWRPLVGGDAGNFEILNYYLIYRKQGANLVVSKTITLARSPSVPSSGSTKRIYRAGNDFYRYEIEKLDKGEYYVEIYAKNSLGPGDRTKEEIMTTGFEPTTKPQTGNNNSKLPAIIGGVVGGVLFIVLIVILVVWCSRRESSTGKKNYPTSYVEDAVDYPPNQGNNLYAKAQVKKQQFDDGDGYNGGGIPLKEPSYSYEQSDKAFV